MVSPKYLNEDRDSPVQVLLIAIRPYYFGTSQCQCTAAFARKRKVGDSTKINEVLQDGDYIAAHPEVRDVILSGDPLMLQIICLKKLESIVKFARRNYSARNKNAMFFLSVLQKLCSMLRKYHPIAITNHPWNVHQAKVACGMLAMQEFIAIRQYL